MTIKIIQIETLNGVEEHVIVDHGNDEFTSMPKAVWDELNVDSEGNK
jgi:hypothetical protein